MSTNIISADVVQFCTICSKPFAKESAYKRHISYCRRAQGRTNKRARSCKECNAAKAKCTFNEPCTRCRSRGLHCVYEKPSTSYLLEKKKKKNHGVISARAPEQKLEMDALVLGPSRPCEPPEYEFGAWNTVHVPAFSPRTVTALRVDPVARNSAQFILESLRGLLLAMKDREMSSWFIHGHWYAPTYPHHLARCSEMASLYLNQKCPSNESFSPVIDQENRWLLKRLPHSSLEDLILGMQSQIIYMIMCTLDSSSDVPQIKLQSLMTFDLYGNRAVKLCDRLWCPDDRLDDPQLTWEQWIFAETRRRCSLAWFLLSRVMDLRFGVTCPSVTNYRALPLCSPGPLWEARTREGWEAARQAYCKSGETPLRHFGDLVGARSAPPDTECGKELSRWYANCDKLGLLLTFATTMV
ncbi:hypothetical protein M426DRAFT_96034 [Hypoxylon sp. CI-4A]|nr:hypothetical protein M426DRAFT_96034 [Hypoxylon sp. CI-4A]